MTARYWVAAAVATTLLASGCVRAPRPAQPVQPPASAIAAGVTRVDPAPAIAPDAAARALIAFRTSCPALMRRTDQSGLTIAADWQAACRAAPSAADPIAFFRDMFVPVRVGSGAAFATGYYEPEIAGSRSAAAGYAVPIYRKPGDLVETTIEECPPGGAQVAVPCKRRTVRGRYVDNTLAPYFDRTEIEDGALSGKGLELAWAADPIEFFFLQIQGSGRLRLPDGSVMRIGYDSQNGRDYTGIGALMRTRGLLGLGQTSMQGIMAYLRAHPEEGRAIMRENKSWVFFRELTGPGPVGAMGVAVSARASVATDPAFVPLGAPVMLSMDRAEASGLWIAQDTGGAIKGANRFDTFWGAGDAARATAGGMSARGTAIVMLPKASLARIGANGRTPPRP